MSLRQHSSDLPSVGATPVSVVRASLHAPVTAVRVDLLLIDLLLIERRCGTLA